MLTCRILFMFILNTVFYTHISAFKKPPAIHVTSLTNHIYRRLYCVEQLHQTIDYIHSINQEIAKYPSLIRTIIWEYKTFETNFSSPYIQSVFQAIVQEQNLNALCALCTDFQGYKSVEDEQHSHALIKSLFIVVKSMCMITTNEQELLVRYSHGITLCRCLDDVLDLPIDQLVEVIGVVTKFCQSQKKDISYLCEEAQERLGLDTVTYDEMVPIDLSVSSQEVLVRFYYVKRLSQFKALIDTYRYDFIWHIEKGVVAFKNHCIRKTITELESSESIEPLIDLFDDFSHYKNAYNEQFCKEALIVFFVVLKNSVMNQYSCISKKKQDLIEKIMLLYREINILPIEEILDAIDLTIQAFNLLKEEEELADEFSSSKQKWKKSWWAKTVGVLLILLKVIHHYHYYY